MDITIKYGRDMSPEEFNKLLTLDVKFFGSGIFTNKGMALKRFLKFRDSIFAAYSGDTLMGFVCFYSVDCSIYHKAVFLQEFIDDNLYESQVKPLTKEHENYILLFDLVVDLPFRNQNMSKLLFGLVGDYLKQKHNEGFAIGRIFGYAITPKGFRILSSCGGRNIWTKGDITFFEVDKERFMGTL